jgi:hypothetical protein
MNIKRLFLIAVSIAVILMGYMSCVTSKKPYQTEEVLEKIAGDWKNIEFDRSKKPARRVIDQQGNVTVYDKTYDESGKRTGKITITKAWTETEGWLWFKDEIHYNDSDTTVYELSKLDLQKMDWSLLWSEGEYPEKWDSVEYQSYFYRK